MTVQEALGEAPNGSGFVITLGPAPGLDATNLVVGRVVGGMDLVRCLSAPCLEAVLQPTSKGCLCGGIAQVLLYMWAGIELVCC